MNSRSNISNTQDHIYKHLEQSWKYDLLGSILETWYILLNHTKTKEKTQKWNSKNLC